MYRFHQRDKKALPADSPGTRSLSQLTWVKELDKKFKLAEQQMIEKQEAEKQKRRQLGLDDSDKFQSCKRYANSTADKITKEMETQAIIPCEQRTDTCSDKETIADMDEHRRQELIKECMLLKATVNKNESEIAQAESELENQSRMLDELYGQYNTFTKDSMVVKGKLRELKKIHKNHKQEKERLRIEHQSYVLDLEMIQRDIEQLDEEIHEICEKLKTVKEVQDIGKDNLGAVIETTEKKDNKKAEDNKILRIKLELLKSEFNKTKLESISRSEVAEAVKGREHDFETLISATENEGRGDSRIPKPRKHPYGSATRACNRFRVSADGRYSESGVYERTKFVPEGQEHIITPTLTYINPTKELKRLLHKRDGIPTDSKKDHVTIHVEDQNKIIFEDDPSYRTYEKENALLPIPPTPRLSIHQRSNKTRCSPCPLPPIPKTEKLPDCTQFRALVERPLTTSTPNTSSYSQKSTNRRGKNEIAKATNNTCCNTKASDTKRLPFRPTPQPVGATKPSFRRKMSHLSSFKKNR